MSCSGAPALLPRKYVLFRQCAAPAAADLSRDPDGSCGLSGYDGAKYGAASRAGRAHCLGPIAPGVAHSVIAGILRFTPIDQGVYLGGTAIAIALSIPAVCQSCLSALIPGLQPILTSTLAMPSTLSRHVAMERRRRRLQVTRGKIGHVEQQMPAEFAPAEFAQDLSLAWRARHAAAMGRAPAWRWRDPARTADERAGSVGLGLVFLRHIAGEHHARHALPAALLPIPACPGFAQAAGPIRPCRLRPKLSTVSLSRLGRVANGAERRHRLARR